MAEIRPFTMPKWGIEMTEGVLAAWGVDEGQPFTKGQVLAVVETDKISNDIEAEFDGVLARRIAEAGETYAVGALLGVATLGVAPLGEASAEAIDSFVTGFRGPGNAETVSRKAASPAGAEAPASVVLISTPAEPPEGLRISPAAFARAQQAGLDPRRLDGSGRHGRITFQDVDQALRPEPMRSAGAAVPITATGAAFDGFYASPLAKRLAVRNGVDLAKVRGTGPRGRIRKQDVLDALPQPGPTEQEPAIHTSAPEPAAGVAVVRMSPMRKAIARQLTLSKTTIPHFYLRTKVRVDALKSLRDDARRSSGEAPSVNDYIVRACALALIRCPDLNIQVHGEEIHRFPNADIAVAVATDKGLLTPLVRAAETKTVAAISREIRSLAERARAGRLQPEDYQGGGFSVSNLGMFGIEQFDAIINPPQGAILAVGAAGREMIETPGGAGFASVMALSLSCDHRAIDGATGAHFLAVLKGLIEAPEQLTA